MLIKRLLLGFVGVIAWGIFSRTISGPQDFLSNLLNGLANFCFFIVGQFADLFKTEGKEKYQEQTELPTLRTNIKFNGLILRTSIAIAIFMILANLFASSFIFSIDQMIHRGDANFDDDGYRDVQTYFFGYIAILLSAILAGYFYHLGSISRKLPFSAIFIGNVASIGLAAILYLIYGAFRPLQITNYLGIQAPAALGPYRPLAVDAVGWILTLAIDILAALLSTTWLFMATRLGSFLSRKIQNQ